ncbi:MAG: hypothetical protein HN521_23130 [Candidatus Latescibacteria bacterium]|nr:hypothetical protein [Candidatus Latescibacterota bacterium]
MVFEFSEKHIADYHLFGYTVFREILPSALVEDLRKETDKAREIAYEVTGSQAQRLQPLSNYDLNLQPFKNYGELPELNDAIHQVLTPNHYHADLERTGILLEPAEYPWCTDWHRDWRYHMPEEVFESEFREEWDEQTFDIDAMNQINCALYDDPSTWIVPGSHYRQRNLPGEVTAKRAFDAEKHRGKPTVSNTQRERDCLAYVTGMPGAVQLRLNAGDFALYRSSAWHIGNYVPYRKRATIHDFCGTPAWSDYVRERVPRKDEAMAQLKTAT